LDKHFAYGLDVGQAAPVAGIERSPSLVLLVAEIVRRFALFCFDIVARMPSARFSHRFLLSGWKMRRLTKSLVGCRVAYY
jgi:hypothetical protein